MKEEEKENDRKKERRKKKLKDNLEIKRKRIKEIERQGKRGKL